jgi:hypothetical protein
MSQYKRPYLANIQREFETDRSLVSYLEQKLPTGALVFQLPLQGFPEVGPTHQMHDYEQLRPFIHATSLRFSHGAMKGRGDDGWQVALAALRTPDMVAALERYGFGALLINRKGFADAAIGLSAEMQALGYDPLWHGGEYLAYALQPAAYAQRPAGH